MSDIVERLKRRGAPLTRVREISPTAELCREAASEIERLRAENFAFAAGLCPHHYGDEFGNSGCREIDRLRGQVDQLTKILEDASSGFIPMSSSDEDWNARRDALISEVKSSLSSTDGKSA